MTKSITAIHVWKGCDALLFFRYDLHPHRNTWTKQKRIVSISITYTDHWVKQWESQRGYSHFNFSWFKCVPSCSHTVLLSVCLSVRECSSSIILVQHLSLQYNITTSIKSQIFMIDSFDSLDMHHKSLMWSSQASDCRLHHFTSMPPVFPLSSDLTLHKQNGIFSTEQGHVICFLVISTWACLFFFIS